MDLFPCLSVNLVKLMEVLNIKLLSWKLLGGSFEHKVTQLEEQE